MVAPPDSGSSALGEELVGIADGPVLAARYLEPVDLYTPGLLPGAAPDGPGSL
jgi:hypothetical protein